MKLIQSVEDLSQARDDLRGAAVTIGNFDGVHLGHAKIMERLCQLAQSHGGPSVVFTFDPHPVRLLRPDETPPPLTWTNRKAQLLEELGIEYVVAYPTDEALLGLSPDQFFQQIIVDALNAAAIVEGPNFYFGKGRAGDVHLLKQLCENAGISMEVVQPIVQPFANSEEIISSSRVREAVASGDVQTAREMLTQPYRLRGLVSHGAGRGNKIGFPTANLQGIDTLIPARGVYAGRADANEKIHPAAINIGPAPTFGENESKVEVHLVDFTGNLYGQVVEVDFLTRLREIQPFDGVDALVTQLQKDVAATRAAQP